LQTTVYEIKSNIEKPLMIAIIADTHDKPCRGLVPALYLAHPDMIAVPGDLMNALKDEKHSLDLLQKARMVAPTFYSPGNHENLAKEDKTKIEATGAIFLDDDYKEWNGLFIGGLASGFRGPVKGGKKETPAPDLAWLDKFSSLPGYKILLNHHPEYYPKYLKDKDINLILSGHAHGGQWRIFGHGVFAFGQGLFPRYDSGVYDGRLVVSRGLANHFIIPRIFNRPELVVVDLIPSEL